MILYMEKRNNLQYPSLWSHYGGGISTRIIHIIMCMIMQLSSQLFSDPFSSSPSYFTFFKDILGLEQAKKISLKQYSRFS